MTPKSPLVRIGDFFFKWRNYAFPLILAVLFLAFPPAPRDWWIGSLAALLVIVLGLATRFATIGWAYIKRGGMNKQVYADTLVTTGYFGLCRNPLYVGNLLIYIGTFLFHGHPAVIIGGSALFLFLYSALVAAEEYFLRAKFGAEFESYCARVPRWVPRIGQHRAVTEGMQFSLYRSVTKDYSTIASTLFSVIMIAGLRAWWWQEGAALRQGLWQVGGALFALAVLTLAVRSYKLRSRSST